MLSVLIQTANDEAPLARTLASLVNAAVEGIVREVIVIDTGSTDQTHRVAEHAGCRFVSGSDIGKAITTAKSEWLMFLEPGARPAGEWMEPVAFHISSSSTPARFSHARDSGRPFLQRVLSRKSALRDGLIISKSQATALLRKKKTAFFLARGISARRLEAHLLSAPARKREK